MSIRPIDLRSVLDYVPLFRNHVFVISIDGNVVIHERFPGLVKDIAVLHSLGIKVVLCHGIAHQLSNLSEQRSIPISDDRGEGMTDPKTLDLAIEANASVQAIFTRELAANQLPFVQSNALSVRPIGIIEGIDQLHTGTCEKLDLKRINAQLERSEIPLFSPVVHDNKGRTFRINSDNIAAFLATNLQSSKLIYLSTTSKLCINGEPILNCSAELLAKAIKKDPSSIQPELFSKAKQAIKVLNSGTHRVHLLDGTFDGCLLLEIFDKIGLGTMIHSNEYDRIRKATAEDLPQIYSLVQQASRTQSVVNRSMEDINAQLEHFFVYEVDETIIGCTSLIPYADQNVVELASVCVSPFQQGKGIGRKLAEFTVEKAKNDGYDSIFALSTQASEFFTDSLGFKLVEANFLPKDRLDQYERSHRNSLVMKKEL
jgi:amino-acid N-acetyltransferase